MGRMLPILDIQSSTRSIVDIEEKRPSWSSRSIFSRSDPVCPAALATLCSTILEHTLLGRDFGAGVRSVSKQVDLEPFRSRFLTGFFAWGEDRVISFKECHN